MGHSVKRIKRYIIRRSIFFKMLSSAASLPYAAAMVAQMEVTAVAGDCTVGATSLCSGPASGTDVTPFFDYNNPVDITTASGFGLSITNGDYGMSISADGGASFIDDHASSIETNGDFGLYVENDISGNVDIVSTGSVTSTGAGGDGIRISNYGADTTVRANHTQGQNNGINVDHHGTGAINIVSTGTAKGLGSAGIFSDSYSGTSMTIEAVTTEGTVQGIFARNNTSGALNVTSSGLARGTNGDGIRADNYGTDVSVTASETRGHDNGIVVQNSGTGALHIDSTGKATGGTADGIYTYNAASSTSATINTVDATGGSSGIYVVNLGSGATTVTSTGTVTGGTSNGAVIRTGSNSSAINATFNNVQGDDNGIRITHQGLAGTPSNAASISIEGHILGGSGYGIQTDSLAGVLTNISVHAGAVVESTAGNAIANGDGDSNVIIAAGAAVNGRVDLGFGNDTLTVRNTFSGITILNGGGGGRDTLNFSNISSATHYAGDIQNWSEINLENSHLKLTGNNLTVGVAGDMTTGVHLRNKSTLDTSQGDFSLVGNLSLTAGTSFFVSGNGIGTTSISGVVENGGTISSATGGAGDAIRIGGDYVGDGGTIVLETELGGDISATDKLDVAGDSSGTSNVRVININGVGAATKEGIELITVQGASNALFSLLGDYQIEGVPVVVAGAYSYQLLKGNQTGTDTKNWYLRSELISIDPDDPDDPLYQPGVPIYEAYPQTLLHLNDLPTLQQRVGNRFWLTGTMEATGGETLGSTMADGIWARIETARNNITAHYSTAGTEFDQNKFRAQAGIDQTFYESASGTIIGGITAQYMHGSTDTSSIHGIGQVSTGAYGAGATLTWHGVGGAYLDAQVQAAWYESDLRSVTANRFLVRGNNAFGYALSLEGGHQIALGGGWSMTPQTQLTYSHVEFDRFSDVFGSPVSLDKGASLQGRLGLTLDWETEWKDAKNSTSRAHAYGISNIYNEFLGRTRVDVSSEKFDFRKDRLWAGLGAGGSLSWNDDAYSLYAEGLVNTSLADIGNSYSLEGKIGFRAKW